MAECATAATRAPLADPLPPPLTWLTAPNANVASPGVSTSAANPGLFANTSTSASTHTSLCSGEVLTRSPLDASRAPGPHSSSAVKTTHTPRLSSTPAVRQASS